MSDEFCTPQEAQEAQARYRRELFPNAPAEIPCKRCQMMMPNPVIESGVFSTWCTACIRSRCSKKTVQRMVNREAGLVSGISPIAGMAPPRPVVGKIQSNSAGNGASNGKPQLTLSSYL